MKIVYFEVWTKDGEYSQCFKSINKAKKYYKELVLDGRRVYLDKWQGSYTKENGFDGDYLENVLGL